MMMRGTAAAGKQSTITEVTTYRTARWAGGVVLAGIGLLLLSNIDLLDSRQWLEATVNQLGGLLVTTGGLAVLWELRGKREIMDEILEKTKVSSDIHTAGIERATMDWTEPPWDALLRESKKFSIFISYGSGWRSAHWPKLREFAKDSEKVVRVYLPDPDDEMTMKVLADRYSYSLETIRSKVREAARDFASLSTKNSADIRVHYRAGDHTYTCYKFDEKILVTLYSNARERSEVPVMLVSNGTFYDFFAKDLESIERQSNEVALDVINPTGEASKTDA